MTFFLWLTGSLPSFFSVPSGVLSQQSYFARLSGGLESDLHPCTLLIRSARYSVSGRDASTCSTFYIDQELEAAMGLAIGELIPADISMGVTTTHGTDFRSTRNKQEGLVAPSSLHLLLFEPVPEGHTQAQEFVL